MSSEDDADAVDRVLRGDVNAFSAIVQRWQGPLVNLAFRFCRDPHRAEDMAQEAFIRAFRGLASWRRDSTFSTWLFALATNVYRSELRRLPPLALPVESAEMMDPSRMEEREIEEAQRRILQRAIQALPEKYRETMILFYFHDMDVAETARSLQLPEGTVKARLSRGREVLRGKLVAMLGEINETG